MRPRFPPDTVIPPYTLWLHYLMPGSAEYLANIYNCGSCNTANGNTGATQLTDFQSLDDSCKNQNYTGATQSFTTKANPTPSTSKFFRPFLFMYHIQCRGNFQLTT